MPRVVGGPRHCPRAVVGPGLRRSRRGPLVGRASLDHRRSRRPRNRLRPRRPQPVGHPRAGRSPSHQERRRRLPGRSTPRRAPRRRAMAPRRPARCGGGPRLVVGVGCHAAGPDLTREFDGRGLRRRRVDGLAELGSRPRHWAVVGADVPQPRSNLAVTVTTARPSAPTSPPSWSPPTRGPPS